MFLVASPWRVPTSEDRERIATERDEELFLFSRNPTGIDWAQVVWVLPKEVDGMPGWLREGLVYFREGAEDPLQTTDGFGGDLRGILQLCRKVPWS